MYGVLNHIEKEFPNVIGGFMHVPYLHEQVMNKKEVASLSKEDVVNHSKYIREELYNIYNQCYEKAKPNLASEIRKAICRFDELLYQVGEDNGRKI